MQKFNLLKRRFLSSTYLFHRSVIGAQKGDRMLTGGRCGDRRQNRPISVDRGRL